MSLLGTSKEHMLDMNSFRMNIAQAKRHFIRSVKLTLFMMKRLDIVKGFHSWLLYYYSRSRLISCLYACNYLFMYVHLCMYLLFNLVLFFRKCQKNKLLQFLLKLCLIMDIVMFLNPVLKSYI